MNRNLIEMRQWAMYRCGGKLVPCGESSKYKGLAGFKPTSVRAGIFQPLGFSVRFGSQRLRRHFQSEECGKGILSRERE